MCGGIGKIGFFCYLKSFLRESKIVKNEVIQVTAERALKVVNKVQEEGF